MNAGVAEQGTIGRAAGMALAGPVAAVRAGVEAGRIDLREFRRDVTSQHGENGILAKLFDVIGETNRVCVEFGAYELRRDSTVYPLWAAAGWQALLIEANEERVAELRRECDVLRAGGEVTGSATIVSARVRASGPESLDAILERAGIPRELDLLVIDVDGADYHIWKALARHVPRAVVIEFNPTIPTHLAIVGAGEDNRVGCSARAVLELARSKGYSLVACTLVNAIFVLDDLAAPFAFTNDLEALFDPSALCYLMSSYDGGAFLSRRPMFDSNLFSAEPGRALDRDASVYLPSHLLRPAYVASRLSYAALERVLPGAARRALAGLRALRRRVGARFLAPPDSADR